MTTTNENREGLKRARAAFDRWFAATGLDNTHRGLTACAYHDGFSAGALAPSPTGNEAPRGDVPAGWRLVPTEMTDDLREGYRKVGIGPNLARDMHRAMLAATPTPAPHPVPAGQTTGEV